MSSPDLGERSRSPNPMGSSHMSATRALYRFETRMVTTHAHYLYKYYTLVHESISKVINLKSVYNLCVKYFPRGIVYTIILSCPYILYRYGDCITIYVILLVISLQYVQTVI